MAISETINSIKTHLGEAYASLEEKGATIPTNKNIENLADSILSIEGGGGGAKLFTGHYDTAGLKQIGWTDEEIQYYQENGVQWNAESDDAFKLTEEELAGDDSSSTRFLPKTSAKKFFSDYNNLIAVPKIDISSSTSTVRMFEFCYCLKAIPEINTSNVTNMSKMFYACKALTTIPKIDTSKVTNMSHMFYTCNSLLTIPLLETNSSQYMSNMFTSCYSLKTIPEINTSNVTTMESMFYNCLSLNSIPALDLSKTTSTNAMFRECSVLQKVKLNNTNKVQNAASMFSGCSTIKKIFSMDFSSANNVFSMFGSCSKLIDLGGLINLGKGYTQNSANYSNYTLNLSSSNNLTHDSLMNVINNLYDLNLTYDVAGGGTLYTQKLQLGSTNLNKLSDEEKNVAVLKGWTLS